MNKGDTFSAQTKDEQRFIELLSAKWVAQALSAAAELGVFDTLQRGDATADVLAVRLDCRRAPLVSLLRVLAGEGLVEQDEHGTYRLTPLGAHFTSDEQGVLARFIGTPSQWNPWALLPHAIRSGKNAFELANGASLFSYLRDHPDEARLYHEAVDVFTRAQARALSESGLFEDVVEVVDVGGGRGSLLMELVRRHQHLSGILIDLPEVVEQARRRFADCELSDRLHVHGCDFFQELCCGHDCYVIKHVLHNWADEQAVQLLKATLGAMRSGGKIIVVDDPLLPGNQRDLARYMDLEMFVVTGEGRERSKPELRQLFAAAGLKLVGTRRLTLSTWAFLLQPK